MLPFQGTVNFTPKESLGGGGGHLIKENVQCPGGLLLWGGGGRGGPWPWHDFPWT